MAAHITPATCTTKLTSKKHYEYPLALKEIVVKVSHPDHDGQVATLDALLINRFKLMDDFLSVMDEESDELQKFAFGVFDMEGKIKSKLVEHEHHKGSGCWGRELNDGMLIYVSTIHVEPEFRRRGFGTLVLQQLMTSKFVRPKDFLAAWPTNVGRIDTAAERIAMHDGVVALFRRNGFRRIGRTQFFAWSPDPAHPSRSLAEADDAPSNEGPVLAETTTIIDERDPLGTGAGQLNNYPLHHAIFNTASESPNYDFLPPQMSMLIGQIPPGPPRPPIEETIQKAFEEDPPSVRKKDSHGMTPLHVAAASHNIKAIRALLSLPASAGVRDDLADRHNTDGSTPLEVCETDMESTKAFSLTLLSHWKGHDSKALQCMYALKIAAGEDPWTEADKAQGGMDGLTDQQKEDRFVKLRTYGCTCGECLDGWLSPRMQFRLASNAEELYDMIGEEPFPSRATPMQSEIFFEGSSWMDNIPTDVRPNVNKTWHNVYQSLFLHISKMLKGESGTSPIIPTPAAVVEYVQTRGTRTSIHMAYLSRGGKIEYALDALLLYAQDRGPRPDGDGTWESDFEDWGGETCQAWKALPTCENDKNFSTVRDNLGIAPRQERLGYFPTDESDGTENENALRIMRAMEAIRNGMPGGALNDDEDDSDEDDDDDDDDDDMEE